jgi:hypothetical protein
MKRWSGGEGITQEWIERHPEFGVNPDLDAWLARCEARPSMQERAAAAKAQREFDGEGLRTIDQQPTTGSGGAA